MGQDLTTLGNLLDALPEEDETEIVFGTGTGDIRPGYHLTEFRLARIEAIDCGRGRNDWVETQMQLLDGSAGSDYMTVGRFHAIAGASIRALPGLEDGQLVVEAGFAGAPIAKTRIGAVERRGDRVHIGLTADHAQCRPAMAAPGTSGCCGADVTETACCGASAEPSGCCGAAA